MDKNLAKSDTILSRFNHIITELRFVILILVLLLLFLFKGSIFESIGESFGRGFSKGAKFEFEQSLQSLINENLNKTLHKTIIQSKKEFSEYLPSEISIYKQHHIELNSNALEPKADGFYLNFDLLKNYSLNVFRILYKVKVPNDLIKTLHITLSKERMDKYEKLLQHFFNNFLPKPQPNIILRNSGSPFPKIDALMAGLIKTKIETFDHFTVGFFQINPEQFSDLLNANRMAKYISFEKWEWIDSNKTFRVDPQLQFYTERLDITAMTGQLNSQKIGELVKSLSQNKSLKASLKVVYANSNRVVYGQTICTYFKNYGFNLNN